MEKYKNVWYFTLLLRVFLLMSSEHVNIKKLPVLWNEHFLKGSKILFYFVKIKKIKQFAYCNLSIEWKESQFQ